LKCAYCIEFRKSILGKIVIVATRCHILKLKCNKFDFGSGGAYSAGFKGPTSKGRKGTKDWREGWGRARSERRGPTSKAKGEGR